VMRAQTHAGGGARSRMRRWAEGASAVAQARSRSWCGRCRTAWPARSGCRSAPGTGRCPG
jgi:hypothetical protein